MAIPYLRPMCICIAIFELLHSIYFIVQSVMWLQDDIDFYDSSSFVSSILWFMIAFGLIMGILCDFYKCIIIWLLFATCGVAIDLAFLGYVVNLGLTDWDKDRGTYLLIAGIFAEVLCVAFILMYYLNVTRDDKKEVQHVLGETTTEFKQEAMIEKQETRDTVMHFNLNENHKRHEDPISILKWNEPSAPRIVNKKRNKDKKHNK